MFQDDMLYKFTYLLTSTSLRQVSRVVWHRVNVLEVQQLVFDIHCALLSAFFTYNFITIIWY